MKRFLMLLMVCVLLVPTMVVVGQGGDELTQTYTTEDGSLTFGYPDGWFVNIDEEDESISVSNVEELTSDIGEAMLSGQVSINVGVGSPEDFADDGFALPMNASAEFMAGFWTGLYSIAFAFTAGFSDEPSPEIVISEVEHMELNGENAAIVQIDLEDAQSVLIITMPSTEMSIRTLIVVTAYGEMDDYHDIAVAMMESVEFTP